MIRNLLIAVAAIALVSCSVSKKMNHVAQKAIFSNKHFESAHSGIAIYDPAAGKFLYDYQSDKYFVPASNTKLTSCYLAMKYLSDSIAGIQYQQINDSTVLIAGTGDPTVLHPDFQKQPVFDFLKNFKEIHVFASGFDDYLGNGWAWNDYIDDYSAPRSSMPLYGDFVRIQNKKGRISAEPSYFNSSLFASGNISGGMSVSRPWDRNLFTIARGRSQQIDVPFIPADSTIGSLLEDTLHSRIIFGNQQPQGTNFVYTQPLDTMLAIMMHRSDNFFAEQSLLMVSRKLIGVMDDRQIIKKILETDFKDLPQVPGWADGSGLSRYNLFTPQDFVIILNKMKNEFGMERMKAILPTGGTGTLSSLYKNEKGYIFAKTGTLNGVVALSGYLITKKNKLLIFSFLVNNHRSNSSDIRKGVEQFLIGIRNKN